MDPTSYSLLLNIIFNVAFGLLWLTLNIMAISRIMRMSENRWVWMAVVIGLPVLGAAVFFTIGPLKKQQTPRV
jgi:hypothetical protein